MYVLSWQNRSKYQFHIPIDLGIRYYQSSYLSEQIK